MKRIFLLFIAISTLYCIKINAQTKDVIYYLRHCPYLSPNMESLIGKDVPDSVAIENLKNIVVCRSQNEIKIKTSSVSSLSLGLLEMINNSDLIAVIFSVNTPSESSVITFFSNDFTRLPNSFLSPMIDKNLFIPSALSDDMRNRIIRLLSPLHLQYNFVGEANTLKVSPMVVLSQEDKDDKDLTNVLSHLPSLYYKWNGIQYVLEH